MSSDNFENINVMFGGILPPPQLLHALEGGSPHILPNKFMSLALKSGYTSNLLDRKTLKKIDEGEEVSNRTWNKLFNARELQKAKEQIESGLDFEAGASTIAWHGFVKGYHNRPPLTNTLNHINDGIRQEIGIQAGRYCLADAIDDWSLAAMEKHYVSEKVAQWLLNLQSHNNNYKKDRLSSGILSSDMGRLFMTELVVSSTIAFFLRYELDLEAAYCPCQVHSKNRYLSLYFENKGESRPAMELLVSFWQRQLGELSKKKISRRRIADFMPGESDIDEKSRQLRAWTSGENMPKDENMVSFLLNAIQWLRDSGCSRETQSEITARYLYKIFRMYMVMDTLKHDASSRLFKLSDFSGCYKRQASLI